VIILLNLLVGRWKKKTLYIVMEYHDYDLLIWINRPVEQHFKEKILFDISKGMEHLHNLGLAHRDLKPQNILIKINKNDNNIIVKMILKLQDMQLLGL